VRAVAGVDLDIGAGEIVGIAGESGSGKTTLCAALVRALPKAARVSGDIRFDGRSIHALSQDELRQVRGRRSR
jgi:ABC-type glutathione transport system ATPase component